MNMIETCDIESDVASEHARSVTELRTWAGLHDRLLCRTDEDFLLMFLRSCEFDMEYTKKTLSLYYQSRVRKPEWWTDRDLTQPAMKKVMKLKVMSALIEIDSSHPVITLFKPNRFGADHTVFDDAVKLVSVVHDVIARRPNGQSNGHTCIVDLQGYPWWFAIRCLNPLLCKDYISSFVYSIPICLKKIIFLNAPYIFNTFTRMIQPMLSQHHKHKIHTFGSDFSNLGEVVPLDALPEEYGGFNGTLEQHEEAFAKELIEFNDYLIDDEKYGFRSTNF